MFTVERILIPAIATVLNIMTVAPPSTELGIARNKEPMCGNKPITTKIIPTHTPQTATRPLMIQQLAYTVMPSAPPATAVNP